VREGARTNNAERYFSQLEPLPDRTHHHVSAERLDCFLAEFAFLFWTWKATGAELVGRAGGRSLTYHQPVSSRAKLKLT
jgi:hypothetical protein